MAPGALQTRNRDEGPEPPTPGGFRSTLRRHLFRRKRDGNKSIISIEAAGVSADSTPRTSESAADNVQVPHTAPKPEDEYFGPISALWGEEYANLTRSEEEGDGDCFFREYKSVASKLLGISIDDLASNKADQRAETARVQKTLEGLIDEKKWTLGPFGVKEAIKATVEVVNGARDLVGAGITASGYLPASLAWSGVCILLLPLVSALAANDERVSSLQDIAVIIAICDVRESFYAREFEGAGLDKIKQSNTAHGVFRKTLSQLYGDILRFYAHNVYYLSRNTPARFLRDFAKRDDWKAQLQGIKEKETAVDKAISEVLIQHKAEFQRLLTAIGQDQVKLLQSQVNLLQRFVKRAERDDSSQILKSLEVIDHEAMLSSIRYQRPKRTENVPSSSLGGTHGASAAVDNGQHLKPYPVGKWLLENNEFVEWKTSPNSVLWLHGHVGAGKTLLSETVITHLNGHVKHCREQAQHAAVAYCFVRFSEPKTFKRDNIVKSLIAQFYAAGPATAAALLLREQIAEPNDEKEIDSVLQEFISSCPGGAYVVIDGVDECPDTGPADSPYGGEPSNPRQHLLDLLQALPGQRSENLHLFVSSRPAPDIRGLSCRINPRIIDLRNHRAESDHDISDLIDATLGEPSFEGSCLHKNEELQSRFKGELLKRADGVIQYARIALSRISREVPLNETQLSRLLEKLPDGLNALYKEALLKVPETHHETIRRLLIWQLFFVNGPMNLAEVGEACRIPLPAPEQPDFKLDPSFPNPRGIVDRLPGILLVQKAPGVQLPDPENNTDWVVTVGHYSFIEFLQSNDIVTDPKFQQVKHFAIDVDKARMQLALACLSYLFHSSRQLHLYRDLEQFLQDFPLSQRSADGGFELAEHVRLEKWSQPFRDALKCLFFGPKANEPIRLLNLLAVEVGPGCGSYDYVGALTYFIDVGHTRILRFILDELLLREAREENNSLSDSSLTRKDVDIGLHRACAFELPAIVALLLKYEADPQTPAETACVSEGPDTCQRVQADPDAAHAHAGQFNPTCAIDVALQSRAIRALRALLEWRQGKALQSCNDNHHIHLISAAMHDDKRCYYELLQHNPYVGAEIDGLPVLHVLVLYGTIELSTFLRSSVGSKVDYKARDRCFGTALQCAVAIGRGGSVHDLLMAGASMDDPSDPGWETLLRDMSKGEHFNVEWFVNVWGFPDGDEAAARLRAFQEVFGDRSRESGLSPEDRQHLAGEAGHWIWEWEPLI